MVATLVLLRHGQSEWNRKNIFTGFVDIGLSEKGKAEAAAAGHALREFAFDVVFTSVLKRAIDTATIALKGGMPAKFFRSAALNERHYGILQGRNKDDARKEYGVDQIHLWRRGFDSRPPNGESLKDTCDRVVPYFENEILPWIKEDKTVLVAAHGNSLRALIKTLDNLSDEQIVSVEVPTGVPIVYRIDSQCQVVSKEIFAIEEALS